MPERKLLCAKLGAQFRGIMLSTSHEDRTAAEAIGLIMEKTGDRATVTISKEAAEQYFDPITGNSLGWILDEIASNGCAGELKMIVNKMRDESFLVIQKFSK